MTSSRRWSVALTTLACAVVVSRPVAQEAPSDRFWPQWRGPDASGVSRLATPPLEWSESKNIRWKVPIPGRGVASPIVWEDRIYLLTAVPVGVTGDAQHEPRGGLSSRGAHRFTVLAIDRGTGKTVWERVAREQEPHEASHHENGTWASNGAVVWEGEGLTMNPMGASTSTRLANDQGRHEARAAFEPLSLLAFEPSGL